VSTCFSPAFPHPDTHLLQTCAVPPPFQLFLAFLSVASSEESCVQVLPLNKNCPPLLYSAMETNVAHRSFASPTSQPSLVVLQPRAASFTSSAVNLTKGGKHQTTSREVPNRSVVAAPSASAPFPCLCVWVHGRATLRGSRSPHLPWPSLGPQPGGSHPFLAVLLPRPSGSTVQIPLPTH